MADSVKAPFREAVSIDLFFHKIVEIERFALQVVILDARDPLLAYIWNQDGRPYR